MASLSVRDIDDDDYEMLRKVARDNNRSAAAQVRAMIADLGKKRVTAERAVADLIEFRRTHALKPRPGEDAVSMIRAIRDE